MLAMLLTNIMKLFGVVIDFIHTFQFVLHLIPQ